MKDKVRIALVDDNKIFLDAVAQLLSNLPEYEVVGKFNSGKSFLDSKSQFEADLLLLDIEMPEINGIEVAKLANYSNPDLKIVALTMYQDKIYLRQLLSSGFRGFVNKTKVSEELVSTIEDVVNNNLVFPDNLNI